MVSNWQLFMFSFNVVPDCMRRIDAIIDISLINMPPTPTSLTPEQKVTLPHTGQESVGWSRNQFGGLTNISILSFLLPPPPPLSVSIYNSLFQSFMCSICLLCYQSYYFVFFFLIQIKLY